MYRFTCDERRRNIASETLSAFHCFGAAGIVTHSVHDHPADLQDGHVGLLALVSLPHDGAHSLQAGIGAVQPGGVTLSGKNIQTTIMNSLFTATTSFCSATLMGLWEETPISPEDLQVRRGLV